MMEKFANEIKEVLGDNLIQVVLYNDQDPYADDILIIVKDDSFQKLLPLEPIIKKMMVKKISSPYIMTPQFIESSLDSYPLEFINMKTDYKNLYVTQDHLVSIKPENEWVRLQIERELKGKILLIKSNLLPIHQVTKFSEKLIIQSIFSLKPVLKGFLYLMDRPIPKIYDEIIDSIGKETNFPLVCMKKAFDFAYNKDRLKNHSVMDFYVQYLNEIEFLIKRIEND